MPEVPYVEAALQAPHSPDYVPSTGGAWRQAHLSQIMFTAQRILMMRFVAEDQPYDMGMPHPLLSHLTMTEPSEEDEDDDVDTEAEEDEEEEEHPAPANSVVVALPATDQTPSAEAKGSPISIPAPVPTPVWSDGRWLPVSQLYLTPTFINCFPMVFTTSPYTSSTTTPIPSPSLPLSPPSYVLSPSPPPSPIRSLGYRDDTDQARAVAALLPILYHYHHHLSLSSSLTRLDAPSSGIPQPLPISVSYFITTLLLPLLVSSSAAAARPAGGLRVDYGFVATMDREIRRDQEREVGYRITDSWDEIIKTLQGAPISTDTELGRHMTAFGSRVRQRQDVIFIRGLDDEQSQRQLLAGRLNMLFRDRRAHAYTRHLMETEARLSREAWRRSMDASDLTRGEVMSLRTTVLGQMSEIRELHAADRRRQVVTSEMLKADHRRSAEMRELRTADPLQGQVTALQGQQGPAGGPAQPELPEEAGALTWWNSHVITVSHDVAYAMTWADLRKKMTDKYCPWEKRDDKSSRLNLCI
ncbi:hypothetical protein Tco_1507117 [Tanacetum coccineum]